MKLHLLGTSGYFANDLRHTACLMLPEVGVVLDAGTGLYRVGGLIQSARLDVFLSHSHLDHAVGLVQLLEVIRRHPGLQVTVHGRQDKLEAIEQHLFTPLLFPKRPDFRTATLGDAAVQLPAGGRLRAMPLSHPGGSVGFRLDWPGHSMAYVTDTTATRDAPYQQLLDGVDLLVHECYFPDGLEDRAQLTGHSCLGQVARLALRVGARRLLLTHINPADPRAELLDLTPWRNQGLDIAIAQDQMVVEF